MNLALVVIDVQRGLFEPQPPPADADAVIARINALADKAAKHNLAIGSIVAPVWPPVGGGLGFQPPLLPPSDWAMSCLMRLKVQLERLTWSR